MTPFPWTELLIIFGLIVLNGVFAMSELAIVSAKTSKLKAKAEAGSTSAQTAIKLAAEPGKFLSTVQIGITLIAIITGAYSGASLEAPVGERLAALGVPEELSGEAAFVSVIALTTYLSVVVGELVPKQLALRAAVPVATIMARPMAILARIAAPLVWLLDTSSAGIIRLFGVRSKGGSSVTAEELQMIFADATRSGVIEHDQHQILTGVVRLAERPVRELMTPRTELDWIDVDADPMQIHKTIRESPHSLLPVAQGSPDSILGVVKVRDILGRMVADRGFSVREMMHRAEVVPDQLDAMDALRVLQSAEIAMALVHDEYGHFEGVVTPVDLLTAIAGNFASDQDEGDTPELIECSDGSILVAGALSANGLADRLGLTYGEDREFGTAAGYALYVLKRLPAPGDKFTDQGWEFTITEMDNRRIDKILVRRIEAAD
ncbi:HlyC/CorC family transporter [Erythrobacter sp. SCSIO 43205]|uniref:hemolysin family protein n=1 Tax=Erythrobacter sp. SCSIO 43205 TaxID=2779361 RepID=UPI001CA92291|nr:hemolysin family protein [Erythrobacter sp. SCSIO 43205]UAB78534.1 HlyC/CorC family transporter [Erythrobacter sp. SCSIO 43205]